MQLTFGICTAGGQEARIAKMLESIRAEAPDAEVLVLGGAPVPGASHMPFDDSQRAGWITRKKNLLSGRASNPVVVLLHDYIRLCPGWMASFSGFGYEWDVCTNRILKEDGTRAFDWFAVDYKEWRGPTLVDYSLSNPGLKDCMYPAGNYFLVKKQFILDHPLDEALSWGQNEDYRWMKQNCSTWNYRVNKDAAVQYMKPHHHNPSPTLITE